MTFANFGPALDGLYEAAGTPDAWPGALHRFAVATRSVGCRFRPVRPEPGDAPSPASPDLAGLLSAFTSQGWSDKDPRALRGALLTDAGRVVLLEHDISSDEERRRSPFYQEFLRRHDLLWWAGIVFRVEGRPWSMAIHRSPAQGPFTSADARLFAEAAPHIGRVFNLAGRLALAHAAGAADALERVGRAALVIDATGRVVASNLLVEDIASEGALTVAKGRLHASDLQSDRRLQELVARAIAPRVSAGSLSAPVFVSRRAGRPYMVEVFPATGPLCDVFRRIAALVVITDLDLRQRPRTDLIREAFGLTSAEARLASTLASGEDVRTVADRTGVSYETARTQLRAVFAKTGVSRQAELAALMAPMTRDQGSARKSLSTPNGG